MATCDLEDRRNERSRLLPWLALLAALAGIGGSIFLSLGLHLKACPLCFYQRTFMMSVVAVLGTGLVLAPGRGTPLSLFALPLATAGLGVAGFHVSLEMRGILECPQGALGLGTAPQQSLAAFVLLSGLLVADVCRRGACLPSGTSAVLLGLVLAGASCVANPPMPPAPTQPYPAEPDICRPPFRPQV